MSKYRPCKAAHIGTHISITSNVALCTVSCIKCNLWR